MPTSRQLFREYILRNKLGDIFDPDKAPVEQQAFWNGHKMLAQRYAQAACDAYVGIPLIHFEFINNTEFNARAFKEQGQYFIGVNHSVLPVLSSLFDQFLSHPQILAEVGACELESEDNARSRGVPIDQSRALYAAHLKKMAYDFIVWHELAHITRGHVDFGSERFQANGINESPSHESWQKDHKTIHLREYEADRHAIGTGLNSHLDLVQDAGNKKAPADHVYSSRAAVFFAWSFAANSLWRLFEDAILPGSNLIAEHDYPPMQLRQMVTSTEGVQFFGEDYRKIEPQVATFAVAVTMHAEHAFSLIGRSSPKRWEELSQDTLSNYWNELNAHWLKLEPLFNAYKTRTSIE